MRPASGGKSSGAGTGSRAAASGRWKPSGKEKPVVLPRPCGGGSLLVGVKRAMAFVPRRKKKKAAAAAALAIGWVMHEYRLAAPLHKHVSDSLVRIRRVHASLLSPSLLTYLIDSGLMAKFLKPVVTAYV